MRCKCKHKTPEVILYNITCDVIFNTPKLWGSELHLTTFLAAEAEDLMEYWLWLDLSEGVVHGAGQAWGSSQLRDGANRFPYISSV